jgi:hypothetical protein
MMKIKFSHLFLTLGVLSLLPPAALDANATTKKMEVRKEAQKNWSAAKTTFENTMKDYYSLVLEAEHAENELEAAKLKLEQDKFKAKEEAVAANTAAVNAANALAAKQAELKLLEASAPTKTYVKGTEFQNELKVKKIKSLGEEISKLDQAVKDLNGIKVEKEKAAEKAKTRTPETDQAILEKKKAFEEAQGKVEENKDIPEQAMTQLKEEAERTGNQAKIKESYGWLFGGKRKGKKLVNETDNLDSTSSDLVDKALAEAKESFRLKHNAPAPDISSFGETVAAPAATKAFFRYTPEEIAAYGGGDAAKIKDISPSEISKLTGDQLKGLAADQIKNLTVDQIKALTPSQIPLLRPDQFYKLTDDQLKQLTPDQVQAITADQRRILEGRTKFLAATPSGASTEASKCDEAEQVLADLLLKGNNSKVFSDMVYLAQLKMAYRLAGAKPSVSTIEAYLNQQKLTDGIRAANNLKDDLVKAYVKYGITADMDTLNSLNLFDAGKRLNYGKGTTAVRLDNHGASAAVLYLSQVDGNKDDKDKTALDFTEADAASVWALEKFAENKGRQSADQNLLRFSTRICRMFKNGCGGSGTTFNLGDVETIKTEYEAKESAFKTSVEDQIKNLSTEQKLCFEKDCPSSGAKIADIEKVKTALTKAVMSGSIGTSIIDESATKATGDGTIVIKFKKSE